MVFELSPLFADFVPRDRRLRPVTVRCAELVGRRFTRLLVVAHCGGERSQGNDRSRYLCICDCGSITKTTSVNLKNGNATSCGCRRLENFISRSVKHGASRVGVRWPEYGVWAAMISRCNNPKNKAYPYYGGRGIKVHSDFSTFEGFIKHLGRNDGLTLERFNVNEDYAPGNVGWVTREDQAQNKRNTVRVVHEGIEMSAGKAFRLTGFRKHAFDVLRKKGVGPQEAFDTVKGRHL